tara:strand:+ start:6754 stop:7329 length:576 start_codon:yes stop_codon:yes gene_type:complete
MNIFVLDEDPCLAAKAVDCVRVPKMVTESAQMMASAVRRWGATDEQMPIAKTSGKPYKGAYKNHPCTLWAGDSYGNFRWLSAHALGLCFEYEKRFDKVHACMSAILKLHQLGIKLNQCQEETGVSITPFALAMPEEFRTWEGDVLTHSYSGFAVEAYRNYYHSKMQSPGGVHYRHTSPPDWWIGSLWGEEE